MKIRNAKIEDYDEIYNLLYKSFLNHPHGDPKRGPIEHLIVKGLLEADALNVSLVMEEDNKIVGYIAFSPVSFDNGAKNWVGLGPVAVLPEYQNQSIGSKLINEGLKIIKDDNYSGCVVMGEPEYYSRFGFVQSDELYFEGVPKEYFMYQKFGDEMAKGNTNYHKAFYI